MNKLMALLLAVFVLAGYARASNIPYGTITVSASNVVDSTGTLLASGTVYFTPVDNNGNPISYHINGLGQALNSPVSAPVTNGAFSLQLPDTSKTIPVNVCFSTTIIDATTGTNVLGNGYSCMQPSSTAAWCTSSVCSFDTFFPATAGNNLSYPATISLGTVTTGAPGTNAAVTITGTPGAGIVNFTIPAGPQGPIGSPTSGVNLTPTATQVVAQPSGTVLSVNNLDTQLLNGIPQADQFSGADFCVKLRAANVYALANNIGLVDATHFSGIQQCSVDPFNTLATALSTIKLTDMLPAAWIETAVPFVINNSGLNIFGKGPAQTWIDYTGTTVAPAVISTVGSSSGAIEFNQIEKLSVLGNNANVTDGLYFTFAHRWKLEDVSVWGVTGAGVHTVFAVTPTMIRVRVSSQDASIYGWLGTGRSTPANGFTLDGNSSGQTTDGTVIDAAAEYLTGVGWNILDANSMTFTSGTSEGNAYGIYTGPNSTYNTFIGTDIEANTANVAGVDVNDTGASNYFRNIISTSTCTSCTTVVQTKYWGFVDGGYIPSGISGTGANQFQYGNTFTWPITFASGLISNGNTTISHVKNATGIQTASGPGCTITAGAVGNSCTSANIYYPVAPPDANSIITCTLLGGLNGTNAVANIAAEGSVSFTVTEVALSTTSTGGGTINCTIVHN